MHRYTVDLRLTVEATGTPHLSDPTIQAGDERDQVEALVLTGLRELSRFSRNYGFVIIDSTAAVEAAPEE